MSTGSRQQFQNLYAPGDLAGFRERRVEMESAEIGKGKMTLLNLYMRSTLRVDIFALNAP
jgi:hypothetical protein